MPLIHGKSQKAFTHNLKAEMKAGKPQNQSLAIAYGIKKRAMQHKAHGGSCYAEGGPVHTRTGYQPHTSETHPSHVNDEANLSQAHQSAAEKHNASALGEDGRRLNQHGDVEQGPQHPRMAEGGKVMTEDERNLAIVHEENERLGSQLHNPTESGTNEADPRSKREGDKYGGYAEGGTIEEEPLPYDDSDSHLAGNAGSGSVGSFNPPEYADEEDGDGEDMVGRIMQMRQQMFSEGGRVANADHGENDEDLAGFSPNEFDDLTLRDDLEQHYTEASSGDDEGNARTDHDQEDDVARIMKKRKTQRNPNPA
jgi:hypothetical protein